MRQRLSPRDTMAAFTSGMTIVPAGKSGDAEAIWGLADTAGVEGSTRAGALDELEATVVPCGRLAAPVVGGCGMVGGTGADGRAAGGAAATTAGGTGTLKATSARDFTLPETGST